MKRQNLRGLSFVQLTLFVIGSFGCHGPTTGDIDLMARLARQSGEQRLGVALLGTGAINVIWPLNPPVRRIVQIGDKSIGGRPALLVDWGRALAVQDIGKWRVMDLHGNVIVETERNVNGIGAVLQRENARLLFWGGKYRTAVTGVYLGDLRTHHVRTVQEWVIDSNHGDPALSASFTGANGSSIRICRGFENYVLDFDGSVVEGLALDLEETAESPDGRFVVGRQRSGTLLVVESTTRKTWDTGIASLGPSKWDPSSQYVLCVTLTHAPFWMAQTSITIVDVLHHATMRTVAIAPDDRYHPYEWIILPPG